MIQNHVSPEELSSATAFIVWCQYIGPTIFLTVFNTIFDTGLRAQLIEQAPNADAEAIILAGATGFRGLARPEDIPGILVAYSNSLDRVFYLVAAAGIAAWLSPGEWDGRTFERAERTLLASLLT